MSRPEAKTRLWPAGLPTVASTAASTMASTAIALLVAGLALAGCGSASPAAPAAPGAASAVAPGAASAAVPGPLSSAGDQAVPADRSLAGLHACALIPAATVTAALGQLEEPPTESSNGLTCFYNTRQNSESAGPSYILDITTRSAYEVTKSLADGEAEAKLVRLVPIRGIGDEGYSIADSKGGPDYNATVAKGGVAAAIQVNSVSPADEQQAQRLLAVVVTHL